MVGVVLENWKKIAVGDSLGNIYILQFNPVSKFSPSPPSFLPLLPLLFMFIFLFFAEFNIGHADLRVGKIISAFKSPEMVKIYGFEIDVGEPTPRKVMKRGVFILFCLLLISN